MASERIRYYQEAREGIYSGPVFLLGQLLQSLPTTLLSTLIASLVIFRGLKNELLCTENPNSGLKSCRAYSSYTQLELDTIAKDSINNWMEYNYYPDFVVYWLTIWACHFLAEQQTTSLLIVVKSSYTAALASIYISIVYLVLASGTVRYVGQVLFNFCSNYGLFLVHFYSIFGQLLFNFCLIVVLFNLCSSFGQVLFNF